MCFPRKKGREKAVEGDRFQVNTLLWVLAVPL